MITISDYTSLLPSLRSNLIFFGDRKVKDTGISEDGIEKVLYDFARFHYLKVVSSSPSIINSYRRAKIVVKIKKEKARLNVMFIPKNGRIGR